VENVLAGHPAVADIAVFGVPDERWGEVGVAGVVVRAGVATDEEDLLGFCTGKLAGYKIPKAVVFVDHIPRSGGNKILRRVMADQYRQRATRSTRSTR
jgi:fatty-acyl-CoA synthase